MRKIRILFIILAIFGLAVFGLPTSAADISVAALSLNPSADNFTVGSEFEVAVILDTGGQAINVIDVIVYFPEDLIEATGSPTRDGLLPLWQFNASNEKGEINIVGGERQNGVVASNSEITRIKFKVKKEGKAVLKISSKNSNIIAADGFGTQISIKAGQAYYSLITAQVAVETPEISEVQKMNSSEPPNEASIIRIFPEARLRGELEAMTSSFIQFIRWTPSQLMMVPIVSIFKINFAGLIVALVAIIYNARKKKTEN